MKKITEPLPRSLRSRGHQEVIFEVAEAKFWISSNFHRFSLENFRRFGFRGCLTSATSASSESRIGRISNYADSWPLWYGLWCCGCLWSGLLTFIQICLIVLRLEGFYAVISKSVFRYRKVPFYPTNIDNVWFYGKFIDIDIDAQY